MTTASPSTIAQPVVVLTHYLPPYMARVLFHVREQVPGLKVLLSIDQEPNRHFGDTWQGLDVSVQKSLMLRRPWKHSAGFQEDLYVHFPYDTYTQLRRLDPQIVFSYELGFRSLVSALYCKRYRRKLALCVCVSEHTEQGRGASRGRLRRWLLKQADAVTFNGPSCRDYLERFPGVQHKLFHFPYAASDLCRYEGPVERDARDDFTLVCIGQLTARKGVLEMLESLCTYATTRSNQTIKLELIGTGPLQEQIRQKQLPSNLTVNLHGHLDYNEINSRLSRCGVLIFPTKADEWGLVVNEAMQAGIPVIGSCYAQACTTLINPGTNGWIYDPLIASSLSQQLDKLLSMQHDALTEMRHAAQSTVKSITSQASAGNAIAMFRSLL
ncbi:MAG TPA: glycosyl transferase family 1 [Planctomycetaceae bacterium]|nr:glycosyl transferase family 1 [Planctomycetaceae bacterium]